MDVVALAAPVEKPGGGGSRVADATQTPIPMTT